LPVIGFARFFTYTLLRYCY